MAVIRSYDRPDGGQYPMVRTSPAKSIASIIAIVSALVSFYLSSQSKGFLALLAALVAIGAGLVGGMKALSPRVSGGILSLIAVGLGVIAIVAALIAMVF
jgi:hypothetical protein